MDEWGVPKSTQKTTGATWLRRWRWQPLCTELLGSDILTSIFDRGQAPTNEVLYKFNPLYPTTPDCTSKFGELILDPKSILSFMLRSAFQNHNG